MKPVALFQFPGQNRFVGTFDMENLEEWWISKTLPVIEIVDVDWAYAQYHVCVGKKSDGTYSIFQSKNYGMEWEEVLNLSEKIYCVVKIDYGWLVASTASGWYESINAGTDWEKVSTQAPGCKIVVCIADNVLVAHTGGAIYRSTDIARNWTKTLDCHTIYYENAHGGFTTKTYGGDSYPALAGFGLQVFAGAGPYLLASNNGAITWTMPFGWNNAPNICVPSIQPYTDQRIIQLLHADRLDEPVLLQDIYGSGLEDYYDVWMAGIYMPSKNIVRYITSYGGFFQWDNQFDAPFTGYESSRLSSYRTLRPGSDKYDKIIIGTDGTDIMYSEDGWEWNRIKPDQLTVYAGDPTQEISAPNPFAEEDFTAIGWVGHPCHNSGEWITSTKMQRALSWDIDFLLQKTSLTTHDIDVLIAERIDKTYQLDYTTMETFDKSHTPDILTKIIQNKIYSAHNITRKTFDKSLSTGLPLASRLTKEYTHDYIVKLVVDTTRRFDMLLFGTVDVGNGFDVILVSDQTEELLLDFAKYTTQWWNIIDPNWPSDVYDSRNEELSPGD